MSSRQGLRVSVDVLGLRVYFEASGRREDPRVRIRSPIKQQEF